MWFRLSDSVRFYWGLAFAVVFGLGLLTLSRSPLPWFDEVHMASISDTWATTGGFFLGENPIRAEEQLIYGPVYFYLQGSVFLLAGTSPFTARIVGFVAGVVTVFICRKLFRIWAIPRNISNPLCMVIAVDYMFGRGMYSGRMDLLAVVIVLIALLTLQTLDEKAFPILKLIVAGALAGLAFLTTPRVLFWAFGLPFFLNSQWESGSFHRSAVRFFVILLTAVSISAVWIGAKFGGLQPYIEYMRGAGTGNYFGSSGFFRQPLETHIYLAFIVALANLLWNWRSLQSIEKHLTLGLVCTIAAFTFLIQESGPYTAMIIPAFVLTIGLGARRASDLPRKWCVWAILLVSAIGFVGKKTIVISEWTNRTPTEVRSELSKVLTPESIVLADYKYYYEVRRLDATFSALNLLAAEGQSGESDARLQAFLQGVDYVVVDQQTTQKAVGLFERFAPNLSLQRVSEGTNTNSGKRYQSAYDFVLYRIAREPMS